MLAIVILMLISCSFGDTNLCSRKCDRVTNDIDIECWPKECDQSTGRCCFKDGKILVDLRGCNINDLPANAFLKDEQLGNQTNLITQICLNENPIGSGNVSVDTFRGLTKLDLLVIPSNFRTCPGGEKYWQSSQNESTSRVCRDQNPPCNISDELCPDKSHCVDDGPGLMRCECNEGYYGYKCLKKGQFPYATFYGSLGAATIVISGVLWFVGRRKIGLHTKQS